MESQVECFHVVVHFVAPLSVLQHEQLPHFFKESYYNFSTPETFILWLCGAIFAWFAHLQLKIVAFSKRAVYTVRQAEGMNDGTEG